MGFIVDEPDNSKIHGEARRESFCVYTDFGDDHIELDWSEFDNLKYIVAELEKKRPLDVKIVDKGNGKSVVEFNKKALMDIPVADLMREALKK